MNKINILCCNLLREFFKTGDCEPQAFNKLRNVLISENVMLSHFVVVVLPQYGKSIIMISGVLKDMGLNFATNERELLVNVWILKTSRNCLYCCFRNMNIYTDHQPLQHLQFKTKALT